MKVIVVAGARPNFMKVAPILRSLRERGHTPVFVHTGQHYDEAMSAVFLRELEIDTPDYHLGVGSGSHAAQTARIMESFDPVLEAVRPDWNVVVGDVNSTLAVALVVSKRRHELGTRLAHVEAGLRSGDWAMPEEVNRVVTDRLSDLLLTPSRDVVDNLRAEGLWSDRCQFVGNVMIDSLLTSLPRARAAAPAFARHPARPYVLATLHRPSNVDDPERLAGILQAFERLSHDLDVILPIHPRTRARLTTFGLDALLDRLTVMAPLSYLEMVAATDAASVVVTDSGGLQEETTVLGVPCVTLRAQTERPVTVTEGTNRLVPWPPTSEGVVASVREALARGRRGVGEAAPEGWDGAASQRIVRALEEAMP
ncbi:MAG: UDP-N-acetylglucosamine 2-epimerase (non-hydrolyzing) [Gemmatimonadetes bacterium]|nr:UDP-N-acetylglucosamine 2-epimerase (non-hydrolyzing) [Gemmatimonadota bacterium]